MVDTQFGVIGGGGTSFGFNSVSSFNGGFDQTPNALFLNSNRSKTLRPLEIFPPIGAQPTLFQKRAALRQNSDKGGGGLMNLEMLSSVDNDEPRQLEEGNNNKIGDSVKNGGGITRMQIKSLFLVVAVTAEEKLNDRLYMLRSVVPKISKMDRASILGDAIEYLKELLQRINDLHNELESTPPGTALPPSSSFHPLTPTPPTRHVASRKKSAQAHCQAQIANNLPGKSKRRKSCQHTYVLLSATGLLLSTMRALDGLGIDIQHLSSFVSMDGPVSVNPIHQQCKEGMDVSPEEIKAVLLNSAGFHGMI
ncbi:hypothetical protein MKW92_034949 [Papaver armeniacum]|nr:hypothetical protein MKW92_034949 [Papaver armeniacum]